MVSYCGKDYDYIFLDAQIILTRNHAITTAAARKNLYNEDDEEFRIPFWVYYSIVSQTVTSFWYSIRRLLRAYSTGRLVFLWDKQPYFKSQIIQDIYAQDTYKTDRVYDDSTFGLTLFYARQEARRSIIAQAKKFGMNSVIHPGYEADDLAFLAARMFCNQKVGLASHDSDWPFYLTPNSEIINTMKFNLTYYEEFKKTLLGMDPYQYVIHSSSFYGSHNNLLQTVSDKYYKQSFEKTYEMYLKGENLDELFSDWRLLVAQIQSWNIYCFPEIDEVRTELWHASTDPINMGSEYDWVGDKYNHSGIDVYREIKSHLLG